MSQRAPTSRQFLDLLNALPNELLCEIFLHLDICSLLSLRQMDQRIKNAIEDWPSFRTMAAFPKLLAAVEGLQCRYWSIETLLRCIQDERCILCGHFGDLMNLITPERRCYSCFLKDPAPVPRRFKPDNVSMARWLVPSVRLVPGVYGRKAEGLPKGPILAFDECALRRLLPNAGEWLNAKFDKDHPIHYTTVIRAPYWNTSTLRFEEGLICRACAAQGWAFRDPNEGLLGKMTGRHYPIWGLPWRRYSQEGMRDHLEQYGAIFKMQWFDGKRRYVHEKPFEQWTSNDPKELRAISSLLFLCREKEIKFPEGQPFLHKWGSRFV
jgi:hypothetical protein